MGEHLIREQLAPVIGEEGLHASLGYQLPAQGCRVEQLPVGFTFALHSVSVAKSALDREHRWHLFQQRPSGGPAYRTDRLMAEQVAATTNRCLAARLGLCPQAVDRS